mmetsp:Transcript_5120/g.11375  ORF Transcript_5120/g.11375 Transcript_5120/m.11375 type:complete len:525 (-) Transcript_5120:81-1655(-)
MAAGAEESSTKRRRRDDSLSQAAREVQRCNEELAKSPGTWEVLLRRGAAKSKLKEYEAAIADFTLVLATQPNCVAALTQRGKCKQHDFKLHEALQDFDKALKVEPKNAVAMQLRAELNNKLGKSQEAVTDATGVIQLQPSNSHARQIRGEVLRKMRRYSEAISDFNKALELNPNFVNALAGRGATHRALGHHASALADYGEAIRLDPKSPPCLAGRGAVYLELGKSEEAENDFRLALQSDPHSAFSTWGLKMAKKKVWRTRLRCVVLGGFQLRTVNIAFTEVRLAEFIINDRETYWSHDGVFVLYYCSREKRWKVARSFDIPRIREGKSLGILGAPPGPDITASTQKGGWHEWDGMVWAARPTAGVRSVTIVGEEPQALTLGGFAHPGLNGRFVERRQAESLVNGRPTYWSENGQCFLYWCAKESRWKGSRMADMPEVQGGRSLGFAGAPFGADILSKELRSNWLEWDGTKWIIQPKAGIVTAGPVARSELQAATGSQKMSAESKAKVARTIPLPSAPLFERMF